jgi:alpha-ketoglutaric semialdehyde dehydrogenase
MNAQLDNVANAAKAAFREFADSPPQLRAALLRAIAEGVEQLGDALIECVQRETALPVTRLQGERARTCMQLRLFADVAERDEWIDERVDAADPARTPPRPLIRSRLRPLGPALVFAASNFPLAFSVAGGDTAAALAVGCPVIVKPHPAHPETCGLVARTVSAAVAGCGLPAGVFALLDDASVASGLAAVRHPAIGVGAFTGSLQGGLALWRAAQERAEPIPFFAEMGSVNPVFLFADALTRSAAQIAEGLHASITLGVGQFCTQPGVIFLVDDEHGRAFVEQLAARIASTPAGTMLSEGICRNYMQAVASRVALAGVKNLTHAAPITDPPARSASAALFAVDAQTFLANPHLAEEVFGPTSLIVWCRSCEDFVRCAEALPGQLTATIWAGDASTRERADLQWVLEQKVGRIVFDGFPTGVEVGAATMHGGPFPATTDSRFTSVGTRALLRFVRPVAWQTPAT